MARALIATRFQIFRVQNDDCLYLPDGEGEFNYRYPAPARLIAVDDIPMAKILEHYVTNWK